MEQIVLVAAAALSVVGSNGETPTIGNKGLEVPEALVEQIEKEALAGNGDVWTGTPDGTGTNNGPFGPYLREAASDRATF